CIVCHGGSFSRWPGCVYPPPSQPDSGPSALLNCAKHSVRHRFGAVSPTQLCETFCTSSEHLAVRASWLSIDLLIRSLSADRSLLHLQRLEDHVIARLGRDRLLNPRLVSDYRSLRSYFSFSST